MERGGKKCEGELTADGIFKKQMNSKVNIVLVNIIINLTDLLTTSQCSHLKKIKKNCTDLGLQVVCI